MALQEDPRHQSGPSPFPLPQSHRVGRAPAPREGLHGDAAALQAARVQVAPGVLAAGETLHREGEVVKAGVARRLDASICGLLEEDFREADLAVDLRTGHSRKTAVQKTTHTRRHLTLLHQHPKRTGDTPQ